MLQTSSHTLPRDKEYSYKVIPNEISNKTLSEILDVRSEAWKENGVVKSAKEWRDEVDDLIST